MAKFNVVSFAGFLFMVVRERLSLEQSNLPMAYHGTCEKIISFVVFPQCLKCRAPNNSSEGLTVPIAYIVHRDRTACQIA